MKIYTRTGDKGQTSLFGGERVSKASPRVNTYGEIDELNSAVGFAAALCTLTDEKKWLEHVQQDLFAVGAWLASREACENVVAGKEAFSGARQSRTRITDARIQELEASIDAWESELAPMKSFILPGGSPSGASLHLARTVCRRAERDVIALQASGEVVPDIVVRYLNRLADALFVAARFVNHKANLPETPWA